MIRNTVRGAAAALFLAFSCHADLTLRYTVEVKAGAGAPPVIAESLKNSIKLPTENLIRIKGGRSLSTMGKFVVILDGAGTVTMLNPAAKTYATGPIQDFTSASALAITPAVAQVLERMHFDLHTADTGQSVTVAGIRADEHLMKLSVSLDMPGAAAQSGPLVRAEIHTWVADSADVQRIPALTEYRVFAARTRDLSGPLDSLQQAFRQIPGLAEKMHDFLGAMVKSGGLLVKLHQSMFMTLPPAAGLGGDPDAPFIEIDMNLAETSSASIPDSVFSIPADYHSVALSEFLKLPTPVTSAPPPAPVDNGPVFNAGNGVTNPSAISSPPPQYTDEARAAKISGEVTLSIVVNASGRAQDIRVVKSLDPGLDQKAIEAVSAWTFRPGMKDGQPVNLRAVVAVNFRLLPDPVPGTFSAGNGVTNPVPISSPQPEYTREASAAGISGEVTLSIVVNTSGKAEDIRVVKSLDAGLDQKAIEAVSTWTFRPGMRDGQPVKVRAVIEVNFRLLSLPK